MCPGPGRDPGDREDWPLGWRLLHLHQFCKQTQLLCRRRNCDYCTSGQVGLIAYIWSSWDGTIQKYTPAMNDPDVFITLVFSPCRTMYLLGYIPKDDRLYLGDKELNIVSYSLLVSVLEYQTAVMRRDFGMADKVLPTIPKEQRTRVAHFLEKQVRIQSGQIYFYSGVC